MEPATVLGVGSSIVTFLQLAYKVGKRTVEVKRLAGDLPNDLQSIKALIDLIASGCERLQSHLEDRHSKDKNEESFTKDLKCALGEASAVAQKLVSMLEELIGSNSFSTAIKSIRKESRIKALRDELESINLRIVYLLSEDSAVGALDAKSIAAQMHQDLRQFHGDMAFRMERGLHLLDKQAKAASTFQQNAAIALKDLQPLPRDAIDAELDIACGYEDISRAISRAVDNFGHAVQLRDSELATKMETVLSRHLETTDVMLRMARQGCLDGVLPLLTSLVYIPSLSFLAFLY